MSAFAAAGAGFLVAVLWFDLMFDVQARGSGAVSETALASISAYYRRITTEASPMSRLIPVVMLATLVSIGAEIIERAGAAWAAWASLAIAASAIALAVGRTVSNAVRLGRGEDTAEARSRLARLILADHLYCLAAMTLVVGLQLFGRI
jgi:hypothetical protein